MSPGRISTSPSVPPTCSAIAGSATVTAWPVPRVLGLLDEDEGGAVAGALAHGLLDPGRLVAHDHDARAHVVDVRGVEHVQHHRAPAEAVQRLGARGAHARALAGREDDHARLTSHDPLLSIGCLRCGDGPRALRRVRHVRREPRRVGPRPARSRRCGASTRRSTGCASSRVWRGATRRPRSSCSTAARRTRTPSTPSPSRWAAPCSHSTCRATATPTPAPSGRPRCRRTPRTSPRPSAPCSTGRARSPG